MAREAAPRDDDDPDHLDDEALDGLVVSQAANTAQGASGCAGGPFGAEPGGDDDQGRDAEVHGQVAGHLGDARHQGGVQGDGAVG